MSEPTNTSEWYNDEVERLLNEMTDEDVERLAQEPDDTPPEIRAELDAMMDQYMQDWSDDIDRHFTELANAENEKK